MKTIFDLGMRQSPWASRLGQESDPYAPTVFSWEQPAQQDTGGGWFGNIFSSLIKGGASAYQSYEAGQAAEDIKEGKEADVIAARARVEAERIKAAAAQGKGAGGLGIPTGYLILGGLAVTGAVVMAIVLSKK